MFELAAARRAGPHRASQDRMDAEQERGKATRSCTPKRPLGQVTANPPAPTTPDLATDFNPANSFFQRAWRNRGLCLRLCCRCAPKFWRKAAGLQERTLCPLQRMSGLSSLSRLRSAWVPQVFLRYPFQTSGKPDHINTCDSLNRSSLPVYVSFEACVVMVAMFPFRLVNFPLTCFLKGTSEYVWTFPD